MPLDGNARWSALSPRELEVVRLILENCTNTEIADELHLSVNTVRSHVRSILVKSGFASKVQLQRFSPPDLRRFG